MSSHSAWCWSLVVLRDIRLFLLWWLLQYIVSVNHADILASGSVSLQLLSSTDLHALINKKSCPYPLADIDGRQVTGGF